MAAHRIILNEPRLIDRSSQAGDRGPSDALDTMLDHGRKAGVPEDYRYSNPMKRAKLVLEFCTTRL